MKEQKKNKKTQPCFAYVFGWAESAGVGHVASRGFGEARAPGTGNLGWVTQTPTQQTCGSRRGGPSRQRKFWQGPASAVPMGRVRLWGTTNMWSKWGVPQVHPVITQCESPRQEPASNWSVTASPMARQKTSCKCRETHGQTIEYANAHFCQKP